MIPAFTSSSLYLPITSNISGTGISARFGFGVAFTMAQVISWSVSFSRLLDAPMRARSVSSVRRIGRTSTLPIGAPGIRAATWIASFRSRASMR